MTESSDVRVVRSESAIARDLDPVASQILGFGRAPAGWHFGSGGPASRRTIRLALRIYRAARARGLEAEAFHGESGEIALVFARANRSVELTIDPTGRIDLSVERGVGFEFDVLERIQGASIREVVRALSRLSGPIRCDSSDSSRLITTRGKRDVLSVSDSRTLREGGASLYWEKSASSRNRVLAASAST